MAISKIGTDGIVQNANTILCQTSGNVGVGTSSPTQKLSISGGLSFNSNITFTGNGYEIGKDGVSTLCLSGGSSGTRFIDQSTAAEWMRINSSGNVGIGTSSPQQKLQVYSSAASGGQIQVTNSSTGAASTDGVLFGYDGSNDVIINNQEATATKFYTSGSERMRIDSSGNLSVGTTAVYGNSRLSVNSSNQTYPVIAAFNTAASSTGTPALLISKYDNDPSTSQVLMQFLYNNGSLGLGQINGNGGSQAAFGSYSDARLKENIESLPSQLDNILALRPVEFDYKDGSGHQIGFIAQEMQEVYPDSVSEGNDGMLMITAWSKTEARLVKAIQELNAKIEAQAAEITALKGAA